MTRGPFLTPRELVASVMKEDELTANVVKAAQRLGWFVHHDRPARRADGQYRTPVQGNVGFPDLVLARKGLPVLFIELKAMRGRMELGQPEWQERLSPYDMAMGAAIPARYAIWRPKNWLDGSVERVLRGEEPL